jgi:phage shock protein PspC (stress-responsive transcriptional regulator)
MMAAMNETPPAPPRHPRPAHGGGGRRIVREPDDRKIAGVCSGLADYMGVDVTVMRVGAVLLALITPAALIAYLVASVAVPERQPDEPRIQARRVHLGRVPHPVIVVGAIVAAAALVDDAWWLNPFPAAVALVGVGVWLILQGRDDDPEPSAGAAAAPTIGTGPVDATPPVGATPPVDAPTIEHPMASSPWVVTVPQHFDAEGDRNTTFTGESIATDPTDTLQSREGAGPSGEFPPPASPWWSGSPATSTAPPASAPAPSPAGTWPRPRPSRLGPAVVALLFVGGGGLWLLASLDIATVSGADALALGLVVVGVGLLVAAWRGRAYALIPIGLLLATLLVTGELLDVPLDAGTGDRTEIVDTAPELRQHHQLFAGDLRVDLTDAPLPVGRTTRVEASVGLGELHVVVPRDATVEVNASARAGEVVSPGGADANESGIGLDESFTLDGDPGGPRLELDLSAGVGSVEVTRG